MTTNARMIGAAMVALSSTAIAQDSTLTCAQRLALQLNPVIRVNGQIVQNTSEFVAYTGGRFISTTGPGTRSFGITSYNCASCEDHFKVGERPRTIFFTEPVVLSVDSTTPVRVGDVVEAVNDQPITSSAGASQFVHPAAGANAVTVRRGRERLALRFDVPAPVPCVDSIKTTRPDSPIRIRGTSVQQQQPAGPIYVIDGVRIEPGEIPPPIGYGFALACANACSRVTETDGTTFYRYSAAPSITAVRDGSPAATVGLKPGDAVVKIDGRSILEDEAAIRLAHAAQRGPLHVTVLRDGKEIGYLLQAPSKP